jgi:hypothetical protein
MPVQLKLDIDNKFLNGTVGNDSIQETDYFEGTINTNSNRAKAFFDPKFRSLSSYEVAKRMFIGKNELNSTGDGYSSNITINSLSQRLTFEQNRTEPFQNPTLISRLQQQINDINALNDATPDTNDPSIDSAYNPDFPANTVSFSYSNDGTGLNRGSDVLQDAHTPNINYNINPHADEAHHPAANGGGFGNVKTEGTISAGYLDSIQFASKYM